MRFLCLHGMGSNARIFQQQIAAIRYELGNHHSYDFVEGCLSCEVHPSLKENMLGDEQTFSYCDQMSPESCLQVAKDLERYVATEGPYDGIIGFSMGASIAMSWILNRRQPNSDRLESPFKVGIFLSGTFPLYDLEALHQGRIAHLDTIPECHDMPAAHIWGAKDAGQEHARIACRAFKADKTSVYVHDRGHEVPKSADDMIGMVKMINRAIGSVEA